MKSGPLEYRVQPNEQSSECLGNGCWAFQLQETAGPAVLLYAGSSSSIVTSSVFFFCSASGPSGRMLVTVWRRASICSSVSRSSLSSTICRRKENLRGYLWRSRTGGVHPGPPPPMLFPVCWPLAHTAPGLAPEPPRVSRSSPSWLRQEGEARSNSYAMAQNGSQQKASCRLAFFFKET